jgi:hypothetical protein
MKDETMESIFNKTPTDKAYRDQDSNSPDGEAVGKQGQKECQGSV